MAEALVNDFNARLTAELLSTAGVGASVFVAPITPGLDAAHVGQQARARIGTEIVLVTLTTATQWTIDAREAEDSGRYPRQTWPANTAVDLVLTAASLDAIAGQSVHTSPLIVRQLGGTPGTDEGELSHDGTTLRLRNKDVGGMAVRNAADTADVLSVSDAGAMSFTPTSTAAVPIKVTAVATGDKTTNYVAQEWRTAAGVLAARLRYGDGPLFDDIVTLFEFFRASDGVLQGAIGFVNGIAGLRVTTPLAVDGTIHTQAGIIVGNFATSQFSGPIVSFADRDLSLIAQSGFVTRVTASNASSIPLVVSAVASQTANMQEWRDSGGTPHGTVSENGYYTTRKNTAPADAELSAGEAAYWFDATPGNAKLMIKAKNSSGTVVTGEIALS